jgi:hypothetical protein
MDLPARLTTTEALGFNSPPSIQSGSDTIFFVFRRKQFLSFRDEEREP